MESRGVTLEPTATAPTTPGGVIGWIDDRPIPREHLDRRLADLRDGPLSAALPVPGGSEDRQLARWLTQVILTEALCETAARALGLAPVEGAPLDRVAAVELGSINAAAYNGNPWVRALFEHVTATTEIPSEWRTLPAQGNATRHIVRHRLFADRASAERAGPDDLDSLGAVELDSLPAALAEAIRHQPHGTLVGPIKDALGWHLAVTSPSHPSGAAPSPEQDTSRSPGSADSPRHHGPTARQADRLLAAARRRAFARRLDELRAERIKLVPGLEHPGDPRQPDNHHKH
ncbi:peptidyl-prolyl cis-trans isomerase [Nonomuraea turkmeniaca]|uniref:Peptidyl-prolyl cis-trans isomerase n=1 Tax=Nonomuraea turkmeniaca TaxID=103838 RepID=A0A5S4EUE2_9ACTN|nr:peptidyl-prolyl cis-trans isomerase [Nonomuraea turkmeniaca]